MVHYEVKSGVQTITEVCEDCTCHIRDLTIDDWVKETIEKLCD